MMSHEITNVADLIGRHAAERPWASAIIENDSVIHYRTLDRLVWAAAWHLHRAGLRPNDVVGVSLPQSALCLVALLALARIGAVSTTLPSDEPASVSENYIRRFGVKFVVGTGGGASFGGVSAVAFTAELLKDAPPSIAMALRAPGGDAPWNIRRTSGTTSEAKGIAATHRAVLARCAAHRPFFYGPDDRVLSAVSIDMAFGLSACERTFYGGGCVVLPPPAMDAQGFLGLIDRYGVTHVSLTPNYLNALLPHLPNGACRSPLLRQIATTGMAVPEAVRAEIRRRFNRQLLVLYATNETAFLTGADAALQEAYPETVGSALPGVELEIVDDDDRPVRAGETGHIRARTPWMPDGYVNADAEAGRRFRNGWIYPGDLGALSPEGMLFIRGRADDMMNYDGIKIMPADIEAALLAHSAVAEAVAFPVASGRHQHLPVAAVVLRAPVGGDQLIAHCRKLLGGRAPLAVSIETSLPRNAMGKVARQALAAKIAAHLPDAQK
ncbi:MAG: class I adenylate-forming enzyme family protein [Reyranellaceae bacterium]